MSQLDGRSLQEILMPFSMSKHTMLRCRVFTGPKCLLVNRKLAVASVLWNIEPFNDWLGAKAEIEGAYQKLGSEDPLAEKERAEAILKVFVKCFFQAGQADLVEIISCSTMLRQFRSLNELSIVTQALRAWAFGRGLWPEQFFSESYLKASTKFQARVEVQGDREGGIEVRETITLRNGGAGSPALLRLREPAFAHRGTSLSEDEADLQRWYLIENMTRALFRGQALAVGTCTIEGGRKLASIFTCNPEKVRHVLTPLSELEYEYGPNAWIHLALKDSFWPVSIHERFVSADNMGKLTEYMASQTGIGGTDNRMYQVEQMAPFTGAWSPRLSREGLLEADLQNDRWSLTRLGEGKESCIPE